MEPSEPADGGAAADEPEGELDRPVATKYGGPPRPEPEVRPAKKYGAPPRPEPKPMPKE